MAFVGDGDAARLSVRHGPIAVARAAVRTVADHVGVEIALGAVADAEEIAQRGIDARSLAAIVVDAQAQKAGPGELAVGYRKPDVSDHAGALEIGHDECLAGKDALAVVVRIYEAIAAGDAGGGVVLEASEIERV